MKFNRGDIIIRVKWGVLFTDLVGVTVLAASTAVCFNHFFDAGMTRGHVAGSVGVSFAGYLFLDAVFRRGVVGIWTIKDSVNDENDENDEDRFIDG